MEPSSSAVHHPSLRLPLKICGLFDIGLAGGILDVTSMDFDAPALSGNPFSPEGLHCADAAFFDSLVCGDDIPEELLNNLPAHLISSLSGPTQHFLTDLPATDSLDAFANLDTMLGQEMSFDETTDLLNANRLFDKTVYSLLGLESFPLKQPTFPDAYNQETAATEISSEPINYDVFEKPSFDSLLTTSSVNPSLNLSCALNQDYRNAVSFKCAPKGTTKSGSKITSNLLSVETNVCSHKIDTNVRQTESKKEKTARLKDFKEKRKSKVSDLEEEAEMLMLKNENLRQKITELENLTKEMKAKLVASIAGKSPVLTLN